MPSLKDLKNRIDSVKSTRKITQAMQMVAAAKLRRAEEAAEAARPYTERFNAVMAELAASVGDTDAAPELLTGTGSDQTHLLVVMTAERGLCGGFNSSIVKTAKASDTIYWSSKPTPDLLWELKTCELSYLDENFQLTMIVSRPSFLLILSGRDSLGVDGSALARIELPSGEKTKSAFIDVVSEKQISGKW